MEKFLEFIPEVVDFLNTESYFVDRQMWDEWLNLFSEDCEYWLPSWESDTQLITDPQTEVSLIYYSDRSGLEDRVFRLRTGAVRQLHRCRARFTSQAAFVSFRHLHRRLRWLQAGYVTGFGVRNSTPMQVSMNTFWNIRITGSRLSEKRLS
jgi:3-phenylpropionate/cinnamic acid dioxygenase small subunit